MAKYRVKTTDDLLSLSKKFQTTPSAILNQNGIKSLTAGQTLRLPKVKKLAGYWQTGDNERKTVNVGGQDIRLGPNTTLNTQQAPRMNPFLQWLDILQGGTGGVQQSPSGTTSIRGNAPSNSKAPGLASPAQNMLPPSPFTSAGSQARMNEAYVPNANPFGTQQPFQFPTQTGMQPPFGASTQPQYRQPSYGGSYNPTVTPSVPAFSSAGSQTRMNEGMAPPVISTGYQDYGQRINQGVTPTNALPTVPNVPVITPSSRAAGQAQFLSGNGINPESGYIPTRGDVWQMKANARRRRMEQNAGDQQQQVMENTGSAVNQNVSFRA